MMFIIACYESSRVIGAVGYSLAMKSIEAETLINARSSTVWDIITDAGDYSVFPDQQHPFHSFAYRPDVNSN